MSSLVVTESGSASPIRDVVAVLLRHGANVNSCGKLGVTALQLAAANGDLAVLEQLLVAGANMESRWIHGGTALVLASRWGHLGCVDRLLVAGAQHRSEAAAVATSHGHHIIATKLLATVVGTTPPPPNLRSSRSSKLGLARKPQVSSNAFARLSNNSPRLSRHMRVPQELRLPNYPVPTTVERVSQIGRAHV